MSQDPPRSVPDYRFAPSGMDGTARIYTPAGVDGSVELGPYATIWRYCTILAGTRIGARTVIGAGVFLGRDVVIGDDCRIHPGAAVPDGTQIGNNVFIGSNVSLTDCTYPHLADKREEVHAPPVIEDNVTLGCNAVVLPGVVIGTGAMVGAGSVVTRDVPPGAVVAGNPARRLARHARRCVIIPETDEA